MCVSPDDHTRNAAGVDHATHAPWAVVSPPFYDDAASTRERNRLKKGTMHPKLWVLEMRGEGAADAFLRVGIFSSNLGAYDSQAALPPSLHHTLPPSLHHTLPPSLLHLTLPPSLLHHTSRPPRRSTTASGCMTSPSSPPTRGQPAPPALAQTCFASWRRPLLK